jgi:hypothetical protein
MSSQHVPSLFALSSHDDRVLANELRAAAVRQQVALVRALADEVERGTLATCVDGQALREQLAYELARLGCQTLEAAAKLVMDLDAVEESGIHRC